MGIPAALPLLHVRLLIVGQPVAPLHLLDEVLNLCCCLQLDKTHMLVTRVDAVASEDATSLYWE